MDPMTMGAIMGGSALLGGVGSALSGGSNARQINRNIRGATNAVRGVQGRAPAQADEIMGVYNQGYSPYTQNAQADFEALRNASQKTGNLSYAPTGQFDYNLQQGMQQFLDPSMDLQIRQATDAVQGSAANAGGLFSSATGKAISDRAQDISRKAFAEAMQMAMKDRGFNYDVFSDDINRDREAVDFQRMNQADKLKALDAITDIGYNASTNLSKLSADTLQNQFDTINNADLKIADLMMGRVDSSPAGQFGNFLTGANSALGTGMQLLNLFQPKGGK